MMMHGLANFKSEKQRLLFPICSSYQRIHLSLRPTLTVEY